MPGPMRNARCHALLPGVPGGEPSTAPIRPPSSTLLSAGQLPVHARRPRALAVRSLPVLKARGIFMVALAGVAGMIAGILVTAMSGIVQGLHELMFDVQPGGRLSSMFSLLHPAQAVVPAVGGLLLGLT